MNAQQEAPDRVKQTTADGKGQGQHCNDSDHCRPCYKAESPMRSETLAATQTLWLVVSFEMSMFANPSELLKYRVLRISMVVNEIDILDVRFILSLSSRD